MIGDGWIMLGLMLASGLPLGVVVAVIVWPERIPKDRTVEAIRERVEAEESNRATGDF
ncbi:hypothetical protein OG874_37615 [Nocardia sp. NBC_00565]|uniref:hypothetical protein n=1 Tax=Nocardia sp. NBC_00565 TaxID=2975993 RepID=UPI002E7FF515|nr:hypothetical protein [Nocardia sp. NBC_00565]WUC02385.1 hypothetical protein OG874_37615 [Nocardia sp. NBC_00565]